MKNIYLQILFISLLISCKEIYYPEINTDKTVLVVDALITDEHTTYQIKLNYSSPFDSNSSSAATGATVYVTDNNGSIYTFNESSIYPGVYLSNISQFTAVVGNEYTLFITTSDGETYKSQPQKFLSNADPISVYGEKTFKKALIDLNGWQTPVTKEGASIFLNFNSIDNTVPRFRFKYSTLNGYLRQESFKYSSPDGGVEDLYFTFYGWQYSRFPSDFNITGEKFQVNSNQPSSHEAFFYERLNADYFKYYKATPVSRDMVIFDGTSDSISLYPISKRILYLTQYRLNDDAYSFYKTVEEQLKAENKIFDPINPQITGNISCTSDPNKLVFGFFEVSPVSYTAYELKFAGYIGIPTFTKTNYIIPNLDIGISFTKPEFWGN